MVGGGAGYVLFRADDRRAINEFLLPSIGAMAWNVQQVMERDLALERAEAKQRAS